MNAKNQSARELVLTVVLTEDKGTHGDGRPRTHRFRSRWLELGQRLPAFRAQHGLTQDEVGRVVGASSDAAVVRWESGEAVPDGIRRERLIALLDEKLWPELRAALIAGAGLPERWDAAVRWYRRLSRERVPRQAEGVRVATVLTLLRPIGSESGLRERYCRERGAPMGNTIDQRASVAAGHTQSWRIIEAAYGLRWLEIRHGLEFDFGRSLVRQLPLSLLDSTLDGATEDD